MNKIVWLSGSRGYVGRYVKEQLVEFGIDAIYISNQGSDNVTEVNFARKASIKKAIEQKGLPDTFIHLGWGNVYDPHHDSHLNENFENGKKLIDQLYKSGVKRIIHIGSSSEYGERVGALIEEYVDPIGDVNNYTKSKLALAKYGLEKAEKFGRTFIHVRLYYTYGFGQRHNSLINQLFHAYRYRENINLSPCEHYRDYIHVLDAASGILKLSSVNQSGIVNLGSGAAIQLRDFVMKFWESLGGPPASLRFGQHEIPDGEQPQPRSYADTRKLRALTGWAPYISIEEGITKTINQWINNNISD